MTTTIPRNAVGFSELLDHAQQESHRWHDWFNQHSQAFDVKIDIAARRQSATCSRISSSLIYSLPTGCWANRSRLPPKLTQPDSPIALTRPPPMPFSPPRTLCS